MGTRAAVEWWASLVEEAREVTLSGTTILRFDSDGLVANHVDYWVQSDGRLHALHRLGGPWLTASRPKQECLHFATWLRSPRGRPDPTIRAPRAFRSC